MNNDPYANLQLPENPWLSEFRRKMERRFWIAMKHGKDTPEFFEAVKQEGLSIEGDEKKIQKLAESKASIAAEGPSGRFATHVGPDGKGGVEATISFTRESKEDGINAAIKSLGDRTGDDPAAISKDFKKALRARDLGLDDDVRMDISSLLSKGEEVEVGVSPKDS